MGAPINLSGEKFGRLTAIASVRFANKVTKWVCKCECGNYCLAQHGNLRSGHTQSCGHCQTYEQVAEGVKCTVKSGRSFIFDKKDYSFIRSKHWNVDKDGYVRCEDGRLHRLLLGNPSGVVDHLNGNPADNRRSNLRIVTQHQNTQNCSLPKNSTTGFKGVCFDKARRKYMAHIHPDGKMKFLGYFDDPIEAAMAYDQAAFLYFGEFAKTNFKRKEQNEQTPDNQ